MYPADEEVADVGRRVVEADDVAEVAAETLDLRAALYVPQAARAVARWGEHLPVANKPPFVCLFSISK